MASFHQAQDKDSKKSTKEDRQSPFESIFQKEKLAPAKFIKSFDSWSSKKWFIKSPLSSYILLIEDPQNLEAFGIVLYSLFETRYINRSDEPYFGGELNRGEIPPKWSFTVPPPVTYKRERRVIRIFADEKVVTCYRCHGTGLVTHWKCLGTGRVKCPNIGCINGKVLVFETERITVKNSDGSVSTINTTVSRWETCSVCHGVGTVIDWECGGTGKVMCPKCLGAKRLLSFPQLVANFIPETDYRIINPSQLPNKHIYRPKGWFRREKFSGIILVDRTGLDLGEIPFIRENVNSSAEKLCLINQGHDEFRLRRRTLKIAYMPVTQAKYGYKQKTGVICVYGNDKNVYKKGRLPLHLKNLLLTMLLAVAILGSVVYFTF